jgi:hypothetical protein
MEALHIVMPTISAIFVEALHIIMPTLSALFKEALLIIIPTLSAIFEEALQIIPTLSALFKEALLIIKPTTEFVDIIILSPAGSHGRPTSSRSGTRSRGCVPPVPTSMSTSWRRIYGCSSGATSCRSVPVIVINMTVPV